MMPLKLCGARHKCFYSQLVDRKNDMEFIYRNSRKLNKKRFYILKSVVPKKPGRTLSSKHNTDAKPALHLLIEFYRWLGCLHLFIELYRWLGCPVLPSVILINK